MKGPPQPGVLRYLGRDRAAVYPRMVAVLLVLGWAGSILAAPGWTDLAGNAVGYDFMAFWSGPHLIASDPSWPVYDSEQLGAFQRDVVPELQQDFSVPFLNPPVALLWFTPFGWLPYTTALLAWWGLALVAWTAGHLALARALRLPDWSVGQLLFASALFPPTLLWFFNGQATPALFAVLSATLLLLVRGRDLPAGVVLGLLAFKPQVALGFALPLLVARRWSALVGGVASVALQIGASFWLWPETWTQFLDARSDIAAILVDPTYKTWGVQSVYGLAHLAVGGWSPRLADALTGVMSLTGLGFLVRMWWSEPWEPASTRWQVAMAGTLALALTLGLQNFTYDLALLLLPFWVLVAALGARPGTEPVLGGGRPLVGLAVLWLVLSFGPYVTAGMSALSRSTLGVRVALQIPVLVLIAASLHVLRHRADVGGLR